MTFDFNLIETHTKLRCAVEDFIKNDAAKLRGKMRTVEKIAH